MRYALISAAIFALGVHTASAQQFFQSSGGTVNFAKAAFADPTDPANQDMITDDVAITRGDIRGIYNSVSEEFYSNMSSPIGTSWLFGSTVQDVIDGTVGLGDFDDWETAAGGQPNIPAIVGSPAVLYLVDDDAYVDISFTNWGQGFQGGGSFAYTRAVVDLAGIPGDFDGDGDVDLDDFGVFVSSFQSSPAGGPPFADGDFDEDGDVDLDDFGVFVSSFQQFPPPAVAVPEPASAAMIFCGMILAARRQR